MVNGQRLRNRSAGAQFSRRRRLIENRFDHARHLGKADARAEKRLDGDFIGGVERGRRAAAGAQRGDRQSERRKPGEIGGSNESWPTVARSSAATPEAMRSG